MFSRWSLDAMREETARMFWNTNNDITPTQRAEQRQTVNLRSQKSWQNPLPQLCSAEISRTL